MSGRIVGEILNHAPTDLRPAEFLVLIALAEDARDRDRLARYSDLNTLTHKTRLGAGTVRNALSELTRRGILKPTKGRVRTGIHQEYVLTQLNESHREANLR